MDNTYADYSGFPGEDDMDETIPVSLTREEIETLLGMIGEDHFVDLTAEDFERVCTTLETKLKASLEQFPHDRG